MVGGQDELSSNHTYKAHTGPEEVGFREHIQFFGRLNAHIIWGHNGWGVDLISFIHTYKAHTSPVETS